MSWTRLVATALTLPWFAWAVETGLDDRGLMLAVPSLGDSPTPKSWTRLPTLPTQRHVVFTGTAGESGYVHHPHITFFQGRFFVQWNDSFEGEDEPGQRVQFSIGEDGKTWRPAIDLTGRDPKRRYTACGFWLRNDKLYALAALRDAPRRPRTGETPLLLAFCWDETTERFDEPVVIATDFFPNDAPQLTPRGEWLMLGKSGTGSWGPMRSAIGGVNGIDEWKIQDLPGAGTIEEAEWCALPDGKLVAQFRTRAPNPKVLMRSFSVDGGFTWTSPEPTNFPEQGARHDIVRLSNGLYALLVNPNPARRIPFSIALSEDGLRYDRIANVRSEPTSVQSPGRAKVSGYQYMRGLEHDGALYMVYSVNKERIELSIASLASIAAIPQSPSIEP